MILLRALMADSNHTPVLTLLLSRPYFSPRLRWRGFGGRDRGNRDETHADHCASHSVPSAVGQSKREARQPIAITLCPNCGARIVPTPEELKEWRKAAGLSHREIARRLEISASYVFHLENGTRSPSATLIARYRKFRSVMKLRHGPALVLVGWYLLMPALMAYNTFDASAPLSKWEHSGSYDSAPACERDRKSMIELL
jgi:DNA-binding transcriptional regulator YiaG